MGVQASVVCPVCGWEHSFELEVVGIATVKQGEPTSLRAEVTSDAVIPEHTCVVVHESGVVGVPVPSRYLAAMEHAETLRDPA